jgi:hypothetical protein
LRLFSLSLCYSGLWGESSSTSNPMQGPKPNSLTSVQSESDLHVSMVSTSERNSDGICTGPTTQDCPLSLCVPLLFDLSAARPVKIDLLNVTDGRSGHRHFHFQTCEFAEKIHMPLARPHQSNEQVTVRRSKPLLNDKSKDFTCLQWRNRQRTNCHIERTRFNIIRLFIDLLVPLGSDSVGHLKTFHQVGRLAEQIVISCDPAAARVNVRIFN